MFAESESPSGSCNENPRQTSKCCKFYALNRWCRYGERCKYLHDRYSTTWNTDAPRYTSSRTVRSSRYKRPLQQEVLVDKDQGNLSNPTPPEDQPVCKSDDNHEKLSLPTNTGDESQRKGSEELKIPECAYFSKKGWCRYGDNCRFVHPHGLLVGTKVSSSDSPLLRRMFGKEIRHASKPQTQKARVCRYYTKGSCKNNENCRYMHPHPARETAATNLSGDNTIIADDDSILQTGNVILPAAEVDGLTKAHRPPVLKKDLLLSELTADELHQLRNVEIGQLKKRFTKNCIIELDKGDSFVVTVSPTDPDWIFDVQNVKVWLHFPANYPKEVLDAEIRSEDNEIFPSGLISHLTNTVKTWLKVRHETNIAVGKIELVFRPFLKWFDNSMEEHFTYGLRKEKRNLEAESAGIEFIPYEQLPGSHLKNETGVEQLLSMPEEEQNQFIKATLEVLSKPLANENANNYNENNSDISPNPFSDKSVIALSINDLKVPKCGTEIKLRNFQLGENTASIVCQKLHLTIQCTRCKEKHDIVTEPRRKNLIPCPKCHQLQQVTFRPSLLHPFSSVLGYLDLSDCQAVDLPLVDSIFAVDCLNCNRQMSADGVHYGQMWSSWCHNCNMKLSVYIDSTKFQLLQPNYKPDNGPVNIIKLEKKEKKVKDPAIQEGRPLPDNGTCKHYKKSFRWFRFPCCGKAYPCDSCHNEKELEHEMKLATRVICGFCAKEQIFTTNRPCTVCASSMTKMHKDHWEGGKGCRDKLKMSRDDRHKYSGVNKTTSKKVAEQKEKSKKKVLPKAD